MGDETIQRDVLAEDEIQSSPTWRAAFSVLSDSNNGNMSPTELANLIAKRDMIVENNTRLGKVRLQIKPYLDKLMYAGVALGIAGTGTFLTKFWDKLPAIIEMLK
jgi:hypothetical protein